MIVIKEIGPVKINGQTNRFVIGDKLPDFMLDYFKKSEQFEQLKKAGIIGEDSELIRSIESGQQGHTDQAGRIDIADDTNKSASGSSGGNKRNDQGKVN